MPQKLTLLGLFLVFFIPLLIAAVLYFGAYNIDALAPKSHGQLITPVQPLPPLPAVERDAATPAGNLLENKWTLLYWNDGRCNLYCEASLFKMRQVRLSLGKYLSRVQTIYLTSNLTVAGLDRLKRRNPKLIFVQPTDANAEFIERMQNYPLEQVYLLDAFGNLVMRYSNDADAKGMLRDLKKLLSVG